MYDWKDSRFGCGFPEGCISKNQQCDGKVDCLNGRDEKGCPEGGSNFTTEPTSYLTEITVTQPVITEKKNPVEIEPPIDPSSNTKVYTAISLTLILAGIWGYYVVTK